MANENRSFTRRDFIKTTGAAALGAAVGLPALAQETAEPAAKSKVVLIRHPEAVDAEGKTNGKIIEQMLDEAMTTLFGRDDPSACWKEIIKPEDVVGIKTNVWRYVRTPVELEQAIKVRVMNAGVAEKNIAIDDRGILDNPVFKRATALINTRPMRTHAWSGVGSLIKNYIMFTPYPQNYHGNSCAYLGGIWMFPICKDKTRLNILVMLTPQFHTAGPHHFDATYIWNYNGLIVSTDPVAADTIGLRIIQAKRQAHFDDDPPIKPSAQNTERQTHSGDDPPIKPSAHNTERQTHSGDDRPIKPSAHHIAIADTKYNLGTSDLNKIDLIRLGWEEGILI